MFLHASAGLGAALSPHLFGVHLDGRTKACMLSFHKDAGAAVSAFKPSEAGLPYPLHPSWPSAQNATRGMQAA